MQVSIESSEGLERLIKVELPADRVNQAIEKRLKEIARTTKLDGFRPGKVPLTVVRKRFSDQVRYEVFGDLVQSSYPEALMQEKLEPAGDPAVTPVDAADEGGMSYTAKFEVMPVIKLGDLSGQAITRPVADVTDEDLDQMIEKLRTQRITWNTVDREAKNEDQVTVNFKGLIDGEAFDGGSADGIPLVLGSGSMIEGFEAGLEGSKAGDKRTLELKFPDDYRVENLAGKDATFEVEIGQVAESELPEVDEEFAKAFGVTEGGVDAFMAEIRGNMARELEEKIRGVLKEQTMDALLAATPIDVPQALVKQEAEALQKQTKENMAQQGHQSSLDLPVDLFEEQAKKRVALGLIISEVVKENKIEVDDERVRAKVEQFAQTYERPQEVIDYYYGNNANLAGVQNVVLEDQVVDWVLDNAKVEDSTSGFDAVMNPEPETEK
ncbi:MAG: trigger factor [Gammaproteobacteria bacterium]|nr:trigger factor [Gammaproteobacteria bacterium]